MAIEVAPWDTLLGGEEVAYLGGEPARPGRHGALPAGRHRHHLCYRLWQQFRIVHGPLC